MLYRPVVDRVIDISLHWIVNIYNTSYTILRLVIYIWLLVKLLSGIVFHYLAKLVAKSHVCNCQWENDILSPGSTWCRFSNLCLKSFGFSVLWMHNCQCYEVNQIKTVYMHKRTKSRRERERESGYFWTERWYITLSTSVPWRSILRDEWLSATVLF